MIKQILFQPFERFSEWKLFIFGLVGVTLATLLTYYHHVLFLGSLKLVNNHPKEWYICLVNVSMTILANTAVLYFYALCCNIKTRLIDVINVVLIAHWAVYALGILMVIPFVKNALTEVSLMVLGNELETNGLPVDLSLILVGVGLFSLLFLFYFFYLTVVGMRIATNSKKKLNSVIVVILVLLLNTILQYINPYL